MHRLNLFTLSIYSIARVENMANHDFKPNFANQVPQSTCDALLLGYASPDHARHFQCSGFLIAALELEIFEDEVFLFLQNDFELTEPK